MKKHLKFLLIVCVIGLFVVFTGCSSYKNKEYVYQEIVSLKMNENLDSELIESLYEEYNVSSIEELETYLFNSYKNDDTFKNLYLKFDGEYAKLYDVIAEREATYFYKEMEENKIVLALSIYQFDDPDTETNLDPIICPRVEVIEDGDYILLSYYHINHFVTLKCSVK